MSSTSKVSFTVRRPTPVSRQGSSGPESGEETFKIPALPRHLTGNGRSTPSSPLRNGHKKSQFIPHEQDSSDEDDEAVDEMVTGFDQFGVQRLGGEKKLSGPLVIPALQDRDWREVARKRKAGEMFVPDGARVSGEAGGDGSVGGLGTRDVINSGPELVGLIVAEKNSAIEGGDEDVSMVVATETVTTDVKEETEDDRALRALIAEASGEPTSAGGGAPLAAISSSDNDWQRPIDEGEAFRRDVLTRPESASLDDYARVPVEQFGEALLRGMGWKPGQAASRTRTGPITPYVPAQRPSLLGLGAKEREIPDDGTGKGGKGRAARPDRRYVLVTKVERDKEESRKSGASSRRSSRSPGSGKDRHSHRDDRDRERRDRERKRDYESDRERDSRKDRERERRRDRDYDSDYSKRERDRRSHRESDRDRR